MSYEYSYGYTTPSSDVLNGVLAGLGFVWFVSMALCIFLLVCMYKVFKKAGRNGWEALIPIYNIIVMIQIAELPVWYIALFFIPFANIYAMFKIYIEFAHKFGKSTGFGIAMIFFSYICFPILAFGNAQYNGNVPMTANYNPNAVPNNGMQQPNMQMNYNQNVGMNNVVQNNSFNNPTNNYFEPQVQPVPMNTLETPEVQPIPVVMPSIPMDNQPTETVQVPAPEAEPVAPVEPLQPVANVQPESVVETPVSTTIENVQQTSVVEPAVTEPVAAEPAQTNKKFCPQCGNQVDQTDAICFMCGNQF